MAGYQQLCRVLAAAGPGTFAELDSVVPGRCCGGTADAWFAAAKRRREGRARRGIRGASGGCCRCVTTRARITWMGGGCGCRWRAVARRCGCGWTGTAVPGRAGPVGHHNRSKRPAVGGGDGGSAGRCLSGGRRPDPEPRGGGGLGVIHPFAVAGPDGLGLVVSGRAIRAETRLHLSDSKQRAKATARRAPSPGRARSRRWNKTLARQREREAACCPAL